MRSGHPPFGSASKKDPYYKLYMKKPKKWWKFHAKSKATGYYDAQFMDLMTKMFKYKPEERLTLE